MGKHRAANQNLVVVEEQTIDFYQDGFRQQAPRALGNFVRWDRAQVRKSAGEIPAMIEDASIAALSIDNGLAHQSSERRIAHQRVRAEGHQVITRGGPCADLL